MVKGQAAQPHYVLEFYSLQIFVMKRYLKFGFLVHQFLLEVIIKITYPSSRMPGFRTPYLEVSGLTPI